LTELPVLHYQNLTLGGAVRVADYATFGTQELANNVLRALDGRHAALLANHGAVAIGATLPKAADNALLLEWLAALYHRALQFGQPRELTDEQIQDVITQAIRLNYGSRQVRR
jgi:L-fuculose-phosphate aldolase